MFRKKRYKKEYHIDADEVFLDSKNLPFFDKQQLEGKIEKPLSKKTIYFLIIILVSISLIFCIQLYKVQILDGESYHKAALQNALDKEIVFAERGLIYDRNKLPLAWNEKNPNHEQFLSRVYDSSGGLSHILGYVKYPKQDQKGYFWRTEYLGMAGIEKQFNEILTGTNGAKLIETNVKGEKISSNVYEVPLPGENMILSIDKTVQNDFYNALQNVAETSHYVGASGILVDLNNGEIISLVNFPSYDSNVMAESKNEEIISGYFNNMRHPLLNRAIAGLYTPGSIVKPFVGIGALTEGVITQFTKILSHGSISVQNPYNPNLKTIFKDFRSNNGVVNIEEALSVSSNIFFYNVGGGFQSQKGIGITNIGKYWRLFGLSEKTGIELPGELEGIIPNPEWKQKVFPNDPLWRLGDTYNTAIGQYGVQVTPVQMLRAVSMIALDGKKIPFTLLKKEGETMQSNTTNLELPLEHFKTIKRGMRLAVTSPLGTGKGLHSLENNFAVKTGTAQVGQHNEYINTWIIGFFPYSKPRYAFVVLMDRGQSSGSAGAPTAALYFFQKFEQSDFYKKNQ